MCKGPAPHDIPPSRFFASQKRSSRRDQVVLIFSGLQASGKSTLCRSLGNLLNAVWINQDEFASAGRASKPLFSSHIEHTVANSGVDIILIDKLNTLKRHRAEIVERLRGSERSQQVLFLQLRHPQDVPGQWQNSVRLCKIRARARRGHRGFDPDEDIGNIIEQTAAGAEPLDAAEPGFNHVLELDMSLGQAELVQRTLFQLQVAGILHKEQVMELRKPAVIAAAVHASLSFEAQLASEKEPWWSSRWSGSQLNSYEAPRVRPEASNLRYRPWSWNLELDEASTLSLQSLCKRVALPTLVPCKQLVVPLAYLAGGSIDEMTARHPHLDGAFQVQERLSELERADGQVMPLEVKSIIWDNRIAVAKVYGVAELSLNVHSYVTLAKASMVTSQRGSELLARRAAQAHLPTGLDGWLQELGLAHHHSEIAQWCSEMGAIEPGELAENAEELAAHVLQSDADCLARVLADAAPKISEVALSRPLKLQGRVISCSRPAD